MTSLKDSLHHLESALVRLEAAVEHRVGKNASMNDDRNKLVDSLNTAQEENDALRQAAGNVADRLDAAVTRLKSIVEG